MPWHVLLILLIPVAVAILASLLRGAEQKNRKDRPASSSGEYRTLPRQPAARPVTDLDRFLEEARRRREPAERREVVVGREVEPAAKPEPAPRQQRPARQTPTRPREPRVTPRRQPVPLEEDPGSRQSAPTVAPVPVPTAEPVRSVEVPPARQTASALAPMAPPVVRAKAASPVLRQVAQILRTPRSAAVAIVLREIFDPPLCKRRR